MTSSKYYKREFRNNVISRKIFNRYGYRGYIYYVIYSTLWYLIWSITFFTDILTLHTQIILNIFFVIVNKIMNLLHVQYKSNIDNINLIWVLSTNNKFIVVFYLNFIIFVLIISFLIIFGWKFGAIGHFLNIFFMSK